MKIWLSIVAILGFSGVALGAFGAHGIKPQISAESYTNFQTGVSYHFIHTLAILGLLALPNFDKKIKKIACSAFLIGILLFSGSLYLLSTSSLTGVNVSFLGPITPIGGLGFLVGWAMLLFGIKKSK